MMWVQDDALGYHIPPRWGCSRGQAAAMVSTYLLRFKRRIRNCFHESGPYQKDVRRRDRGQRTQLQKKPWPAGPHPPFPATSTKNLHGRLRARAHMKFCITILQVLPHRLKTDAQGLRDFLVDEPLGH